MRLYYWLIIGVLVFSCAGCDSVYRLVHKEGAEERELIGEALPFESNPTVKEIQTLLKVYGYNPGKADGILGGNTREALARFQHDNGLNETRFADAQTWQKLKIFLDNGLIQSGELDIKKVQSLLQKAGFDPGVPDGTMGAKTKNALNEFQKKHDLKVDGKIGYKTLNALAMYLDSPIVS